MAPATHLGAAHPVTVGQGGQQDQTMMEKVTNDAVANIRAIARRHPHLRAGLNVAAGCITCRSVAEALGLDWRDPLHLPGFA